MGLYFDQDLDPDFGTKTLAVFSKKCRYAQRYGNPYAYIFDVYRDTSLDLGVTGAPEHFVIDAEGIIRMHHIGDINERVGTPKLLHYNKLVAKHLAKQAMAKKVDVDASYGLRANCRTRLMKKPELRKCTGGNNVVTTAIHRFAR